MPHFEVLIVGAGTAGCRLARRLSQCGFRSIALIEAGAANQPAISRVPAWYPWCFASKIDWGWFTSSQVGLLQRKLLWPRGKIVGGSGAINALIDIQASYQDWQRWGWDWAQELNTYDLPPHSAQPDEPHPWCESFLSACEQSGLLRQRPMIRAAAGSCGVFNLTRRHGLREHTGTDLLGVSGLNVLTQVQVDRLVLNGDHVTGIYLRREGSVTSELVTADRVVLCAGAAGSPALLLRSGIGSRDQLQDNGRQCVLDLPGVGQNLQDHLVVPIVFRAKSPRGLPRNHGFDARRQLRESGRGSLTSNIAEATAFDLAAPGAPADYQIHFTPTHYWKYPLRDDGRGFLSLAITDLHPRSRGEISLEPDGGLRINPGYLTHPYDPLRMEQAFRWAFELAGQSALDEIIAAPLTAHLTESEAIQELCRKFAQPIYHPIGTCAMRTPVATYAPVVDESLAVLGLTNLWVADASVLPDQPSCNPNRTVILIADRMAQLLSGAV